MNLTFVVQHNVWSMLKAKTLLSLHLRTYRPNKHKLYKMQLYDHHLVKGRVSLCPWDDGLDSRCKHSPRCHWWWRKPGPLWCLCHSRICSSSTHSKSGRPVTRMWKQRTRNEPFHYFPILPIALLKRIYKPNNALCCCLAQTYHWNEDTVANTEAALRLSDLAEEQEVHCRRWLCIPYVWLACWVGSSASSTKTSLPTK